MAWGLRKAIKVGPFRVNISKSAIGISTKAGIFSQSINTKSMGRTSLSLPGTGVFYRKQRSYSNKKRKQNPSVLDREMGS